LCCSGMREERKGTQFAVAFAVAFLKPHLNGARPRPVEDPPKLAVPPHENLPALYIDNHSVRDVSYPEKLDYLGVDPRVTVYIRPTFPRSAAEEGRRRRRRRKEGGREEGTKRRLLVIEL